ncbi:MAG: hypothetical protein GF307_10555 [candidate division Zixibacteria bacterium]|nr:hypothetical protein [candidate division Zixibacteria bacterium]
MDIYSQLGKLYKNAGIQADNSETVADNITEIASKLGGQAVSNEQGGIIEINSTLSAGERHGIFHIGMSELKSPGNFSLLFDQAYSVLPPRDKILFIDTETTGLSGGVGSMAFLIGMGYFENSCFKVRQFFCPDFDYEPAMLHELKSVAVNFEYVVSYNGKCYDIPLLVNRCILNRVEASLADKVQLDLLFPARRLWKVSHGDCSLINLEREILKFYRTGDIPGSEIPSAYFSFLNTRYPAAMKLVITHNRNDILSLAGLYYHALSLDDNKLSLEENYSLGLIHFRRREEKQAEKYFRLFIEECGECESLYRAFFHLGVILKRACRWREAYDCYMLALQKGGAPEIFAVEAAKISEHKLKDYKNALNLTNMALSAIKSKHSSLVKSSKINKSLNHRKNRLIQRLG